MLKAVPWYDPPTRLTNISNSWQALVKKLISSVNVYLRPLFYILEIKLS